MLKKKKMMVAYIVFTGGCEKHESRELKIHVGGME